MSNELQSVLDDIKLDKQTNLKPENIKKDITVLGVTGTLEDLDTSDATATTNDIINPKRIIFTEDLPCHTIKRRGMRFRHIMKRMILPEVSLPSMTKNIRPHN